MKVIQRNEPAPQAQAGPAAVESLDALAGAAQGLQADEASQAQALQQRAADAEAQQQASMQAAAAEEITALLVQVRDVAGEVAEDLDKLPRGAVGAIWTEQRLHRVAVPLVLVLERHGGELGEFMSRYGPYLMLLAAVAVPGSQTVKAMRVHAAAKAPPPAPKPAGEGAAGG